MLSILQPFFALMHFVICLHSGTCTYILSCVFVKHLVTNYMNEFWLQAQLRKHLNIKSSYIHLKCCFITPGPCYMLLLSVVFLVFCQILLADVFRKVLYFTFCNHNSQQLFITYVCDLSALFG